MAGNHRSGVRLEELTRELLGPVLGLALSRSRRAYTGSNADVIARAHFTQEVRFFVVLLRESPVGFLALYEDPSVRYFNLWHLMIDENYQGRGIGRQVIALVADRIRSCPAASELLVHVIPGDGGPEGFYRKCGFTRTGVVDGSQVELRLSLLAEQGGSE